MNIGDIFKKSFLEQTTGNISIFEMCLTLGIALLIGLMIFYVYKKTFNGVMYSKTFNVSLIVLSLISATVIIGVTNNLVLSLGMVGALSIVRFRTSIKDPIDVVYMFWSIGSGIIVGAGLYVLALVSFVFIAVILCYFNKKDIKLAHYLLIINYKSNDIESDIYKIINHSVNHYKIKSKTKTPSQYELTIELRTKEDQSQIVNEIDELEGIINVAMLSYDGDYAA